MLILNKEILERGQKLAENVEFMGRSINEYSRDELIAIVAISNDMYKKQLAEISTRDKKSKAHTQKNLSMG